MLSLRIHGGHRIGLSLLGQLIVTHLLVSPRCHGPQMRLARRRHNGAIGDHRLDDVGSNLLGVLARLAAVVAMAVDTGPHEEHKVQHHEEPLAHDAGQLDALAVRLLLP